MELAIVNEYLAEYLKISQFDDYCPNGLQVEVNAGLSKIVSGVTASIELIEKACDLGADGIFVHHGYFWKGEDPCLTGIKMRRIEKLFRHKISLFAYHLPLDCHEVVGNNVRLLSRFEEFVNLDSCSPLSFHNGQPLGLVASLKKPLPILDLSKRVDEILGRESLVLGPKDKMVQKIALCTGGAQNMFEAAIVDHGVDAYLTGEVSEPNFHLANEYGVNFIAAGHHATERYGIQALGDHISEKFGLEHQFVDLNNPV